MINLKTITMQLIDGKPDGIRVCRVEGESLVTVVVPRELLSEAKQLPELPSRGIYYLLDEDHGILSRVYAGQTTQGLTRLDSHRAKKDFWNKAVMFLDIESNIDRDALDALEAKAIDYIRCHGSYETDNSATPSPYVSPYKEQTVERLHQSILFRMKALGFDLGRADSIARTNGTLFHTKRNGVRASGRYHTDSGHFTVLAGSSIDLNRPPIKQRGVIQLRAELFGRQTGMCALSEDIEFNSPSTAAVFVLGGSANGWMEWVNDLGQTLDYVYRHNN